MRNDLPLRVRAVMGAIGVVLLLASSVVAINYGNGHYDGGYPLTAVFDVASQGIYPGTDVKVRGLNVGQIESIELNDENHAVIELDMRNGVRIPRTVAVTIEPLSIFGPKFINLIPGEDELTGPYFGEDEHAVMTNTTPPVEFTLVLGDATELLKRIDPRELATIIHTAAEGVGGLGDELGRTVDNLTTLVGVAKEHEPEIRQFLADLALVSQTLADHGDELLTGIEAFGTVLPTINERSDEVGALLENISRTANGLTGVLNASRASVDPALIGLSKLGDLLHRRQDDVIDLVNTLDIFFGNLAAVLRIPNDPISPLAGALLGGVPDALCQLFIDLPCQGAPVASSAAAAPASAPVTDMPSGAPAQRDPLRATLELVAQILPTADHNVLASILGGRR